MKPKGIRNQRKELIRTGVHVFYSEGIKTEPLYVESIKKEIDPIYLRYPSKFSIVHGNPRDSRNTIGLVNFAIKDAKERKRNGEQIEHVWIFFDKDNFNNSDYNEAINRVERINDSQKEDGLLESTFKFNKETGICFHALYSNEAFELFYLLYFNLINNQMSRVDYQKKLNSFVKSKTGMDFEYQKNLEGMHQKLLKAGGSLEQAIKRSEKLEKANNSKNPSTTAYLFPKYFKAYFKK